MIKFNKVFYSKIISLILACIFLFTNITYGIDIPERPHLRKPLDFNGFNITPRYLCMFLATTYHNSLKQNLSPKEAFKRVEEALKRVMEEMSKRNAGELGIKVTPFEGGIRISHEKDNIDITANDDRTFGPKQEGYATDIALSDANQAIKNGTVLHEGRDSVNNEVEQKIKSGKARKVLANASIKLEGDVDMSVKVDEEEIRAIEQAKTLLSESEQDTLNSVDIVVVGGDFLYFTQKGHQSLHVGKRRRTVYLSEGLWNELKENPVALAAALAHELYHIQNPTLSEELEEGYEQRAEAREAEVDPERRLRSIINNLESKMLREITNLQQTFSMPDFVHPETKNRIFNNIAVFSKSPRYEHIKNLISILLQLSDMEFNAKNFMPPMILRLVSIANTAEDAEKGLSALRNAIYEDNDKLRYDVEERIRMLQVISLRVTTIDEYIIAQNIILKFIDGLTDMNIWKLGTDEDPIELYSLAEELAAIIWLFYRRMHIHNTIELEKNLDTLLLFIGKVRLLYGDDLRLQRHVITRLLDEYIKSYVLRHNALSVEDFSKILQIISEFIVMLHQWGVGIISQGSGNNVTPIINDILTLTTRDQWIISLTFLQKLIIACWKRATVYAWLAGVSKPSDHELYLLLYWYKFRDDITDVLKKNGTLTEDSYAVLYEKAKSIITDKINERKRYSPSYRDFLEKIKGFQTAEREALTVQLIDVFELFIGKPFYPNLLITLFGKCIQPSLSSPEIFNKWQILKDYLLVVAEHEPQLLETYIIGISAGLSINSNIEDGFLFSVLERLIELGFVPTESLLSPIFLEPDNQDIIIEGYKKIREELIKRQPSFDNKLEVDIFYSVIKDRIPLGQENTYSRYAERVKAVNDFIKKTNYSNNAWQEDKGLPSFSLRRGLYRYSVDNVDRNVLLNHKKGLIDSSQGLISLEFLDQEGLKGLKVEIARKVLAYIQLKDARVIKGPIRNKHLEIHIAKNLQNKNEDEILSEIKSIDSSQILEALYMVTTDLVLRFKDDKKMVEVLTLVIRDVLIAQSYLETDVHEVFDFSEEELTAMSPEKIVEIINTLLNIYNDRGQHLQVSSGIKISQAVNDKINTKKREIKQQNEKVVIGEGSQEEAVEFIPKYGVESLFRGFAGHDCSKEIGHQGNPIVHTLDPNNRYYFAFVDGKAVGYIGLYEAQYAGTKILLVDTIQMMHREDLTINILRKISDIARSKGYIGIALPFSAEGSFNYYKVRDAINAYPAYQKGIAFKPEFIFSDEVAKINTEFGVDAYHSINLNGGKFKLLFPDINQLSDMERSMLVSFLDEAEKQEGLPNYAKELLTRLAELRTQTSASAQSYKISNPDNTIPFEWGKVLEHGIFMEDGKESALSEDDSNDINSQAVKIIAALTPAEKDKFESIKDKDESISKEITVKGKKYSFKLYNIGGKAFLIQENPSGEERLSDSAIRAQIANALSQNDLKGLDPESPYLILRPKRSHRLFGDCLANHILYINQDFDNVYNQLGKQAGDALLQEGLEHELFHEALIFERQVLLEMTKITSETINKEILDIITNMAESEYIAFMEKVEKLQRDRDIARLIEITKERNVGIPAMLTTLRNLKVVDKEFEKGALSIFSLFSLRSSTELDQSVGMKDAIGRILGSAGEYGYVSSNGRIAVLINPDGAHIQTILAMHERFQEPDKYRDTKVINYGIDIDKDPRWGDDYIWLMISSSGAMLKWGKGKGISSRPPSRQNIPNTTSSLENQVANNPHSQKIHKGIYLIDDYGTPTYMIFNNLDELIFMGTPIKNIEPYQELIYEGLNKQTDALVFRGEFFRYQVSAEGISKVAFLKEVRLSLNSRQKYSLARDEQGFQIGGVNTEQTIRSLKQLTIRPYPDENRTISVTIPDLQERMRPWKDRINTRPPGGWADASTYGGFIDSEEDLLTLLAQDNETVINAGLTHQKLAGWLFDIINLIESDCVLYQDSAHTRYSDMIIFYLGRQFSVKKIRPTLSEGQPSPFMDEIKSGYIWEITALDTGKSITFNDMLPFFIWRYGFYEGKTVKFRLNPQDVIDLFHQEKNNEVSILSDGPSTPAVGQPLDSSPQIGKQVYAESIEGNMAKVRDLQGNELGELTLIPETINLDSLRKEINAMSFKEDAHKQMLLTLLSLLEKSPPEELPQFYTFDTLIADLFGFARPQDNLIALHQSIKDNPVALLHELMHYLLEKHEIAMVYENGKFLIEISQTKELFEIDIAPILSLLAQKKWWDSQRQDAGDKTYAQHYQLRALFKYLFGKTYEELTQIIKQSQLPANAGGVDSGEDGELFGKFSKFWEENFTNTRKRNFTHAMVNGLLSAAEGVIRGAQIRIYPLPERGKGAIGILRIEGKTVLSVRYAAEEGITAYKEDESGLDGKRYDWDWIEGRFSLDKIIKIAQGGVERVAYVKEVYESYIEELGISKEEEKTLRSNLATAAYWCVYNNVTPSKAINIYLKELKVSKEGLSLELKKQLIIATYEVAMKKSESSLEKAIQLYQPYTGEKIPPELLGQWLIATYKVAMNKSESSLEKAIQLYQLHIGEKIPPELLGQWLIATYAVAMNKSESSLEKAIQLYQLHIGEKIPPELLGQWLIATYKVAMNKSESSLELVLKSISNVWDRLDPRLKPAILVLTSFWIRLPEQEIEEEIKQFSSSLEAKSNIEDKISFVAQYRSTIYERVIKRNAEDKNRNSSNLSNSPDTPVSAQTGTLEEKGLLLERQSIDSSL